MASVDLAQQLLRDDIVDKVLSRAVEVSAARPHFTLDRSAARRLSPARFCGSADPARRREAASVLTRPW
jgi:hypothetical protein